MTVAVFAMLACPAESSAVNVIVTTALGTDPFVYGPKVNVHAPPLLTRFAEPAGTSPELGHVAVTDETALSSVALTEKTERSGA